MNQKRPVRNTTFRKELHLGTKTQKGEIEDANPNQIETHRLSLLSLWLAGASSAQHTQAPQQTQPRQSSGSLLDKLKGACQDVWDVVCELPGAVAETFTSGEAWQSFAQMSVGAVRTASFGLISPDPQSVSQGWEALGYKPVEPGVADISREVIGPRVGWALREAALTMVAGGPKRLPVKPSPPKPSPVKPSMPATRNTWGAAGGVSGVRSLSGSGFFQNSAQGPLDTHAPVSGLPDATFSGGAMDMSRRQPYRSIRPVVFLPPGNALQEPGATTAAGSRPTCEDFWNAIRDSNLSTGGCAYPNREEMDAIRGCNRSTGGCGYPNPKEEVIGPVVGATLPPVGTDLNLAPAAAH
jgi:hypothetical protein